MLQEIVIKTNANESLKPLVEVAIRNQLKMLQHGILRTKERIAEFEKRAGMSSAAFEKKLQTEEISETIETRLEQGTRRVAFAGGTIPIAQRGEN